MENIQRKVFIKDIAAQAGVTKATVSMALRDRQGVSDETRKKIKQLAKKMGYTPDPALTALANYRSTIKPRDDFHVIPWLTNYPHEDGWTKVPYHQAIFDGAYHIASQLGYRLEPYWIKAKTTRRHEDILYSRGVQGALISPLANSLNHLSLDLHRFCVVSLSISLFKPDYNFASADQFSGMSLICHQLRHLKYRRMGLVMSAKFDQRARHRWSSAFLFEQQRIANIKDRIPPILEKELNPKIFKTWFLKYKPDVLICNDPFSVHDWLKEMKLDVPGEVGIAGTDTYHPVESFYSGLNQHPRLVGSSAMELLHSMILSQERGVPEHRRSVHINPSWIPGKTTRLQHHA